MLLKRIVIRILFYPTLVWNVLLSRVLHVRRWRDRIDDTVILGALPFPSHAAGLYDEGVRGVVNTCEEYGGPVAEYDRLGMTQLYIPTLDFQPPTIEELERAVDYIRQHRERGEGVYVHCKAGRGRSTTVVLCWLIASQGLTPLAAQRLVEGKRPHVNGHIYRRPVVEEFARKQGSNASPDA